MWTYWRNSRWRRISMKYYRHVVWPTLDMWLAWKRTDIQISWCMGTHIRLIVDGACGRVLRWVFGPVFFRFLAVSSYVSAVSASSDNPWKLIFSTTILIDSVSLLFCTFIGFLQFRHRTRFRDSFCLASVFKCLFTYMDDDLEGDQGKDGWTTSQKIVKRWT